MNDDNKGSSVAALVEAAMKDEAAAAATLT